MRHSFEFVVRVDDIAWANPSMVVKRAASAATCFGEVIDVLVVEKDGERVDPAPYLEMLKK